MIVAKILNRNLGGVDNNQKAIELCKERLNIM